MSGPQSTTFRGVVYARCSTHQQDQSIEQQLTWARAACQQSRVEVLATFTDEGVSGHSTSKRTGFHAMLAFCREASRRGEPVDLLVCWHSNRFSRADSIETGWFLHEFRLCGVGKMLTQEKWIDFERLEDRLILTVTQDTSNNADSLKIATASTRAKLGLAQAGKFNGGRPPYGYRIRYRPGLDGTRPVPDGLAIDPETAPVIIWLFESYASGRYSLRQLAGELNAKKTPAPSARIRRGHPNASGEWNSSTVRTLLGSETYLGTAVWNRRPSGLFLGVVDAKLSPVPRTAAKKMRNSNPEDVIRVAGSHEALVTPELFEQVRERMRQMRRRTTPTRGGGDMLLAGLLRCGDCGARMTGRLDRGKRVFICYSYLNRGRLSCRCNRVEEDVLVRAILCKLRQHLTPAGVEALKKMIREEAARPSVESGDLAPLEARLQALDGQVSRAARRLLTAEEEAEVPDLRQALAELRRDRDGLAAEVDRARRAAANRPDVEDVVRRAQDWLNRLEHAGELSRPDLRVFLRDVIDSVEMHFTFRKARVRTFTIFSRGLIYLKEGTPASSILGASCPRSARSTA